MNDKYFHFRTASAKWVISVVGDSSANVYRKDGWIEIDDEELAFIDAHTPDDPEWIARYGSTSLPPQRFGTSGG